MLVKGMGWTFLLSMAVSFGSLVQSTKRYISLRFCTRYLGDFQRLDRFENQDPCG